jgi:hypothetical protein
MTEERAQEVQDALGLGGGWLTLGWTKEECESQGIEWDENDYPCCLGFSWSSCDSCNTRLGGERHMATLWVTNKEG